MIEGLVQRNKRGTRRLWYAVALMLWICVLSVVGFSMSREQLAVRAELVAAQDHLQQLDRILEATRKAARLGCSRSEDFRDQLEAGGLRAVPIPQPNPATAIEFTLPLSTGENAWLSITCPSTGVWLARAGLASGFEELELRAYLHPIRRAR